MRGAWEVNVRFASPSSSRPDSQSLLDTLTSLDSLSPYADSTLERFLTIAESLRCKALVGYVGFSH